MPSTPVEASRVDGANRDAISEFFDGYEQMHALEQYSSELVSNFDETMLEIQPRRFRVLAPRDVKTAVIPMEENSMHITIGVCAFADGTVAQHLAILPLQEFPPDLSPELTKCFTWAGQTAGWVNESIFAEYCRKVLMPEFAKRLAKVDISKRALLVVDGHNSRINPQLMSELREARIDVYSIPAHTSHVLQPLDCGYFRAFKTALKSLRRGLQKLTQAEKRRTLLARAAKALHVASWEATVREGFRVSGIFPVNRLAPLSNAAVGDIGVESLTRASPSHAKRSFISFSSRCLTTPIVIEEMNRVKKSKEQKAKSTIGAEKKKTRSILKITRDKIVLVTKGASESESVAQ